MRLQRCERYAHQVGGLNWIMVQQPDGRTIGTPPQDLLHARAQFPLLP